jgi:DNA helicase HerA-like ATPase
MLACHAAMIRGYPRSEESPLLPLCLPLASRRRHWGRGLAGPDQDARAINPAVIQQTVRLIIRVRDWTRTLDG